MPLIDSYHKTLRGIVINMELFLDAFRDEDDLAAKAFVHNGHSVKALASGGCKLIKIFIIVFPIEI